MRSNADEIARQSLRGFLSMVEREYPEELLRIREPVRTALEDQMGRVEDRLTPALPHQTVHAVFPHTAFRCSSRRGMRRAPARCLWWHI